MRREWFVLHDTGRCLKFHALLLSGLKVTDEVVVSTKQPGLRFLL